MKIEFVENIRGFIPKKTEGIDSLSNRVVFFLESLKQIDEDLFSNWFEQGWSKKEALEKKVVFEKEFIQKVVEKAWDKKNQELGSYFTFWSGKDSNLYGAQISFKIGLISDNKNLRNRVIVSLPISQELRINKNDQRIENIIKLIKEIWNTTDIELDLME
ncbi:hypothetical protein [Flavobacterium sp. KACC 22761]|uniref:hypothetical protein n=1 Tax=Flavobacterium sp. KACC 22761 TaxID=3092665 RepID=UPI002A7562E2|nr:hypothetical protein [Flavobacterium sp. KACC 22761]WPO78021.1 hypothetical protein SCB73_17265 [Flavobacterium sp. KACC 22761]